MVTRKTACKESYCVRGDRADSEESMRKKVTQESTALQRQGHTLGWHPAEGALKQIKMGFFFPFKKI